MQVQDAGAVFQVLASTQLTMWIQFVQVSTVGLAESKFSSGVLVPQVFEGAVAQKAGIKVGDTITKLNGRYLKPSMTAVNDLVNYIK